MGARCSCLSAPNQTTLPGFRLSRRRRCITACAPGCARPGEEPESSVHDDSWVQNRNAGHIQNKSGPLQGGNSQPSVVPDSSGGGHIEPDGLKNADSKGDCTNQGLDPPLKASKDGKEEIKLEEEEESCPTCFEEYDKENPKIIARCGHHFHLSCILEWMERSETCPFCNQDMVFNETS